MINKFKKKDAATVCGLDVSTKGIAFCLIGEQVRWGKLKLDGKDIYETVGQAADRMKFLTDQADYIAIESAVFVKSPQVAIKLAYVFGACISAAVNNNVEIIDVSPMTWQNYIGNKVWTKDKKNSLKLSEPGKKVSWYNSHIRKQRKQFTLDYFNNKFDINVTDDDIGDAFGVAWWAYQEKTARI